MIEELILNGKIDVGGYEIRAKEIKAKLRVRQNQLYADLDPDLPISNGLANFLGSTVNKIILSGKKAYIIVERGPDQTKNLDFDADTLVAIFGEGMKYDDFSIVAGDTDVHIFNSDGGVKVQFLTSVKIFLERISGIRVKKTIILYSVVLRKNVIEVNTSCGIFEVNRSDCGLVR
jgi:hypothetical protein